MIEIDEHFLDRFLRKYQKKLQSKLFSRYGWFACWTKDCAGYFEVCRELGVKTSRWLQWYLRFKYFFGVFIGKTPVVTYRAEVLPRDGKIVFFSVATSFEKEQYSAGQDQSFGSLPSGGVQKVLFLTFVPSNEQLEFYTDKGIVVVHFKFELRRVFDAIAIIYSYRRELTSNWALVLTQDFISGVKSSREILDALESVSIKREKFVFHYEAQPIQHWIIQGVHDRFPASITIGYIHSSIMPVPTHLFKSAGSPMFLFVHGAIFKRILTRHLGWEHSQIKLIQSCRLQRREKAFFEGKILLPYDLVKVDLIVAELETYFTKHKNIYRMPILSGHPAVASLKSYRRKVKKITGGLKRLGTLFDSKGERISVIVGSQTAILEALETGIEPIHICTEPSIEAYSSKIWDSIASSPISIRSRRYRILEKGDLINYGEKPTSFMHEINRTRI